MSSRLLRSLRWPLATKLLALVLLQSAAVPDVLAKTTWRYNYCSTNCTHGSQAPTYACGKAAGYKYYVAGGIGSDAITDRKWRTTRGLNEKMRKCCTKQKGHKACTFLHADGVDWVRVMEITKTGAEVAGVMRGP